MSGLLPSLSWRPEELARGIDRLIDFDQFPQADSRSTGYANTIEQALVFALSATNIEPVPLSSKIENATQCIINSAPMVVPLGGTETAALVVRANRRTATLVGHDGDYHRVPMRELLARLEAPLSVELEATIEQLERDVSPTIARAVRQDHRSRQTIFAGWKIPAHPTRSLQTLASRSTITRVVGFVAVHAVHFGLWILSWTMLVSALLSVGDREPLLALWAVALLSSLLLLPVESLLQQNLATRLGIAIKQGLLQNALNLDEAAVREQGIGHLTARALEANRLDALATQGGLRVLLSAFDAISIVAAFIWFAGFHPLLLLFLLATLLAGRWWVAYYHAEDRLHAAHLRLTAVHTEEMIGYRTRKAFVERSLWHEQEESCLSAYEQACQAADRIELGAGTIPRLWAVCGVAVILLDQFGQSTATLMSVALIGFVIVGFGILHGASSGVMNLVRALVSAKYLKVENHDRSDAPPQTQLSPDAEGASRFIARGLGYAYPGSAQPVVRDVNFELDTSQKVLLTGNSGSGKSTLGALLAGRLQPDRGVILSQGTDRHVVGASGWLKQVCYVPQSGSNHVLTDTFAFNLLLGRSWPPSAGDLKEAAEVVERLGLGPLIERMPAGLMQMVGEGGWRLSQGERARLFLARGILQGARLLIIDELLAPLDPETGLEVLRAVEAMPSQLILIAHA